MTDQQFVETVAEMRRLQKEYFRTRDKGILDRCRFIERQVDLHILKKMQTQPSLFDHES